MVVYKPRTYKWIKVKPFRRPVLAAADGRGKWLAGLIHHHKWTKGAEIGVFRGENLFYLLKTCPNLHMTGIDAWRQRPECGKRLHGAAHSRVDMNLCYEQVQSQAREYTNRVQLYRMESVNAALLFPDEFFDFVFIDASHDTQSVLEDIEAWLPKVRPAGYLLDTTISILGYFQPLERHSPTPVLYLKTTAGFGKRYANCSSMEMASSTT